MKRWPLYLVASSAAVAIWSGWVLLGQLCGFGPVTPLPGIADGFHLNMAITLPVGIEAYGAYAIGAWLSPATPPQARAFARRSAVGALILGLVGQVICHLLIAAHAARAPWPVVVLVSCIPVVTLGFAAALTHLLNRQPEPDTPATPAATPVAPEDDTNGSPASLLPPRMTNLDLAELEGVSVRTIQRRRKKVAANGHVPAGR